MSTNSDAVREPSNLPFIIILVLLVASLASLGGALYINLQDDAEDGYYRGFGGDLRVSELQVVNSARLAVQGEESAFGELAAAKKSFEAGLNRLKQGDNDNRPITEWLSREYNALENDWNQTAASIDTIVANKDRILFLHEVAATLNESIPELQQEYNLVVDILVESGSRSDQAVLAQRQALLGERIARNVGKMLEGGADASDAADQFNLDASLFGSVLDGMIEGNVAMRIDQVTDEEALDSLLQIKELYAFVNNSVDKIFQASPDLLSTRQSVEVVLGSSADINSRIDQLMTAVDGISEQRWLKQEYIFAMAGISVLFMIILAILTSRNARLRLQIEEQTNENSQRAILTLLDELADLADGDLRAKATVTEEFTGAIADSINFTIDQLRVLVSRINDSSESITSASEEAKSTSEQLAVAAGQQAEEITEATLSINEMADTIDGVANEAAQSALVAQSSVQIAKNGADVVRDTIGGMNTIREQIQDTSKRIKRLGESSQEIGDIVSLINDIADQTNILSLNAAIQASMAGDAGRGFAVVADEVQRLAERSSAATKQIEALVKTIQTDTNEAVISMEQTTTEVVRGARLAEDAGVALEEIETVSADISQLIQRISESARSQSQNATQVSNRMNVIQDITTQTSSGTARTADSIGKLTALSLSMRDSVTGFTLPEELMGGAANDTDTAEDAIDADLDATVELGSDEPDLMLDTVSDLGDFQSADESVAPEQELAAGDDAVDDVEAEFEATVQLQAEDALDDIELDDNAENDFDIELTDDATAKQTEIVEEPVEVHRGETPDFDDDFDLELDDSAAEAPAEVAAVPTQVEEPEEDEFMLGLDDDFDLDLDDFDLDEDQNTDKQRI